MARYLILVPDDYVFNGSIDVRHHNFVAEDGILVQLKTKDSFHLYEGKI